MNRLYSHKLPFFLLLPFAFLQANGQNCVPTGLNGKVITTPCTVNCRDLNFQVPDLRNSADYTVISVPYTPFDYVTANGTEDARLYDDDTYSAIFQLPFPFCFYDSVYKRAVVSSNGLITFDTTYSYCNQGEAAYLIESTVPYNGIPVSCTYNHFPRASIMGVFMDLDPRPGPSSTVVSSPPERKIQWRVEGSFPCRKFIVSYYHIGSYEALPCGLRSPTTFQIVIYESTGVIDVFIENKNCDATGGPNANRAILGVQDYSRTRARAAAGKNATASWTALNEGYRFVPSGGLSRFVRSELLNLDMTPVAVASTTTTTPGLRDLFFQNICTAEAQKKYIVRTTFAACDNASTLLVGLDTITVQKDIPDYQVVTNSTPTTCAGESSGKISAVPAAGTSPFVFTLEPGTISQSGNTANFTGLKAGTYTLTVTDATGCSANPVSVTVDEGPPPIRVKTFPFDTILYDTDPIQLRAVASHPDAVLFSWTPSAGLSNTAIPDPVFTGAAVGNEIRYRVEASTISGCKGEGFVTIKIYKGPDIYVPTGFTPNNDGRNDLFLPVPVGIRRYNYFRVYDRWGNLVFSTSEMNKGWDGKINGAEQPGGTYVWMVEGITRNNKLITRKGIVTLVR